MPGLRRYMELRGKKVLIVGLARSGVGAAHLLSTSGAEITITDRKSREELNGYVRQLSPSVKLSLGSYPASLDAIDMIVVSPGVPLTIEPLLKARQQGIKIIGELELAYQMLKDHPPFLAVTGTNGKSTTTTLLGLMLRRGGFRTIVGGNIGNALSEEILKALSKGEKGTATAEGHLKPDYADYVVAEVSSFQLESIDEFKPRGAAILNITPDHLDRYPSLSEYIDAKCRIFQNQGADDFLVVNADDPMTGEIVKRVKGWETRGKGMPHFFYFSRKYEVKGACLKGGMIYFNVPDVASDLSLDPSTFAIKGVHNLENAMASAAMALLAGCPFDAVAEVLREFPGLEHRLEFVRELNGVRYINDSKGTNVGAVLKSLEGFSEPVILIAGGRDKAGDFAQLKPLIKEKVKALILIGEAAERMKAVFDGLTETTISTDLGNAVTLARQTAQQGDVVLLSPACASFDMFRDFEDRGQQFKKIVRGLS